VYSCKDIIEEDVSNETIVLISPADSLLSSSLTHQFRWNEAEDAFNYRFQVASPNFETPNEILADTLVSENSLYWTLYPGTFQWRVRAENAASESQYTTRTLFLDSAETLFGETVILLAPIDNEFTNDELIEFTWQSLDNVTAYILEVLDESGTEIEYTYSTDELSAIIEMGEGEYQWRVYAVNGIPSVSNYQQRDLTIDLTSPSNPSLTLPMNNQSVISGTTQNFQWTGGSDGLSNVSDSLFFYSDAALSIEIDSFLGQNDSYLLDTNDLGTGTFYWVVRTYDQAGNYSQSSSRIFIVN
jgi:hypothetical protein